MSLHNEPADKSNSNRTSKVIATVPITGILVAAALVLSGLSVIGSETAIAQQQNMTGTNVTAGNVTSMNATAGNVTAGNVTSMNATAGNVTGTTGG
jgi:flagellar basal body-associated protein FliL